MNTSTKNRLLKKNGGFVKAYQKTKATYPGLSCSQVLLEIFRSTKTHWTYDELRFMTGYSVFTIAMGLYQIRRNGGTVEKEYVLEARANLYYATS